MQKDSKKRKPMWAVAVSFLGIFVFMGLTVSYSSPAAARSKIFKVTKFAVEASALDAVSAKSEAMQVGETGAFDLLLRRLVPVTSYQTLPRINPADIANMVDGVSVRAERNSSTRYLATLDYSFSPDAIRDVLIAHKLPFVEEQAPRLLVVPLLLRGDGTLNKGLSLWRKAWLSLDTVNALTPLKIGQVTPGITPNMARSILSGDLEGVRAAKQNYGKRVIIFAIAHLSADGQNVQIHLSGTDTIGPIFLNRNYGTFGDPKKALKHGAAISLAILEGRWKAIKAPGGAHAVPDAAEQSVLITVEFSGFREWQKIRGRLAKIPGVKSMDVSSLSARGAEVTLKYPGGAEGLGQNIGRHELLLENIAGAWIMRSY